VTIEQVDNGVKMLVDCYEAVDEDILDEWEANFITDMHERYLQYEDSMFISPKQLEKLSKIYKKL
jgi:hypothetical protein